MFPQTNHDESVPKINIQSEGGQNSSAVESQGGLETPRTQQYIGNVGRDFATPVYGNIYGDVYYNQQYGRGYGRRLCRNPYHCVMYG